MWPLALLCVAALSWPRPSRPLGPDGALVEEGRAQLQRVQGFAAQPRYGACWTRALERLRGGCRELTEDTQSRVALAFAHCHLRRSGRSFPECTGSSSVEDCTRHMDAVAFGTYTEFFTHAHSICYFLQSERWQHQAENTIHRLTESSAGIADQLAATQRLAEGLAEAQGAAMRSQEAILRNGELLKQTLRDSAQGVQEVFEEMRGSAQEQRLAFSEIFNRVAFLQTYLLSESHTLWSLLYNLGALGAAFLLTSARRTSGARLLLFGLVAVNVYLERVICRALLESTEPSFQQSERLAWLLGLLRRAMLLAGLLVLAAAALRFRDARRENLEILRQLGDLRRSVELSLRRTEHLSQAADWEVLQGRIKEEKLAGGEGDQEWSRKDVSQDPEVLEGSFIPAPQMPPDAPVSVKELLLSENTVSESRQTPRAPGEGGASSLVQKRGRARLRRGDRAPPDLVYAVLVDPEQQPRYNLRRSRKSMPGAVSAGESQ
nr:PREDICTED: uncharacterized protein LOC107077304 isoform X1 [Lepisosteus oculatus]